MLISSTPEIGCTFNFLRAPWSFLSSWAADGLVFRTIFRRTVPFPPKKEYRIFDMNKDHDPDRTKSSPILLAAAAACSFAIFTESMAGLGLGGTCGLSCWPLSEEDEKCVNKVQKQTYVYIITYTAFRSQLPSFTYTQMSAIFKFHIRPANPNDVVCIVFLHGFIMYILNFWGPGYHIAADHGSCTFRPLSYLLKRQTSPVGDIRERAGIGQGYSRTCVCQLHAYDF